MSPLQRPRARNRSSQIPAKARQLRIAATGHTIDPAADDGIAAVGGGSRSGLGHKPVPVDNCRTIPIFVESKVAILLLTQLGRGRCTLLEDVLQNPCKLSDGNRLSQFRRVGEPVRQLIAVVAADQDDRNPAGDQLIG